MTNTNTLPATKDLTDFQNLSTPDNTPPTDLPAGWVWVKSGDVINPINNGYTPQAKFLSQNSGDIPFIKVYNLNFDGSLNFRKNPTFIPETIHFNKLSRSRTFPGDILINIVGPPLGKVSIVPATYPEWNINQAIVLFRPNHFVQSKYISYWLQNPITIQWLKNTSKATAGQFNIKVSTCREIPFPLCPVTEQRRIVAKIEELFSDLDHSVATLETARAQLKTYRQAVLKYAFEGKLTEQWRKNQDLKGFQNLSGLICAEREAHHQQQLAGWQTAVKAWETQGKKGRKPAKPKSQKNSRP